MSFRPSPQTWLRDIIDAIAMIEQFTSGVDFDAFRANPMAVAAVERKLQIVSEAAVRLGDETERRCPDLPYGGTFGVSETSFATRMSASI